MFTHTRHTLTHILRMTHAKSHLHEPACDQLHLEVPALLALFPALLLALLLPLHVTTDQHGAKALRALHYAPLVQLQRRGGRGHDLQPGGGERQRLLLLLLLGRMDHLRDTTLCSGADRLLVGGDQNLFQHTPSPSPSPSPSLQPRRRRSRGCGQRLDPFARAPLAQPRRHHAAHLLAAPVALNCPHVRVSLLSLRCVSLLPLLLLACLLGISLQLLLAVGELAARAARTTPVRGGVAGNALAL